MQFEYQRHPQEVGRKKRFVRKKIWKRSVKVLLRGAV